jgi:hypothetical protein
VNLSATKLACVQTELELQQKIDEAAVEVAGLREWLQQTKAPVEVVNGSGTDEVVLGNKEVPPGLAQLSAVVPAAVVKGAASTKPVVVDVEEVGEMEEQQEQQQEQQEQLLQQQQLQQEQEQGLEVKGKWPCPRCTLLNDVGVTSCICDEDGSNAGGPPRRRRTAHGKPAASFKYGQGSSYGSIPPKEGKAKQNASSLHGPLAPAMERRTPR